MIKDISKETKALLFFLLVLQLQVFRRLSTVGYGGMLLIAYMVLFSNIKLTAKIRTRGISLLFCVFYLWQLVFSFFTMPVGEYVTSLIRVGACAPFVLLGMLNPELIYRNLNNIFRLFCLVILLSAILMVYQVFFGRISFFVEVTGRIGFERYGSLLGSTTTYASVSLVAIMLLHDYELFSRKASLFIEIMIIIGGILCLSKGFFINVAIAYALIIIFSNRKIAISKRDIINIVKNLLSVVFIVGVLYILINNTIVGSYFNGMMNYVGARTENDLISRLVALPKRSFDFYGHPIWFYFFTGVGMKAYGGVLGVSYPMTHNNYADSFLAQGLPFLITLLLIYLKCFNKVVFRHDGEAAFVKQIVPYILINMGVGQWAYLPVNGTMFLVIINSIYDHTYKEIAGKTKRD